MESFSISDQPLFYTDYNEISEDDEFLMDDSVMDALERDITDLRDKTNAYDNIADQNNPTTFPSI